MKKILSVLLALALVLCLSCAAFASGEASGDASAESGPTAAITVTDGAMTENDDYIAEHDLTVTYDALSDDGVDGLTIDSDDMLVTALSVTGDNSVYTVNNADIHLGVNEETAYVCNSTTAGSGIVLDSGLVYINDSNIVVDGGANGAEGGHYAVKVSGSGTLVVNNSSMIQTGRGGADGLTDESAEPGSNNGLLIVGFARSSMSVGASKTYYYNSYVETEGWAAMSTDSASGSGLDFYSYNSEAYAVHGGYGIYADGNCRDWLYATTLRGTEHGVIISNNGEVHVYGGASATADDALAYYPEDGELTDAGSLIEAGRNCFYIHSPGSKTAMGKQAIVEVKDSTLRTSEELNDQQDLRDYAEKYSQGVADYLDFIRGSIILVKSHSADIDLTNVTIDSYNNTILMTALNSDSTSRYLLAGNEDTPTTLDMTDMTVTGDIRNLDYQRCVTATLTNTEWTGASIVWEADDWNAYWDYADGMDSVYWANLDAETYNVDHHGTTLILADNSVWNVTEESSLDALTVDETSVVNGIVTVDGEVVDTTAGGTWEGTIVVSPAASGEASAEASAETSGAVDNEAYHAYLKEYVDACPAVSDEQYEEFCALIDADDYTTMPADMMFDATWWGYAAMTYDEFVAAGGVYEIPAFDPSLTAD